MRVGSCELHSDDNIYYTVDFMFFVMFVLIKYATSTGTRECTYS